MNTYHQMTPPEDLSPNELAAALTHYSGIEEESRTAKTHVCSKCRPQQVKEFFKWFSKLPTKGELQEMYVEDIQRREHELQITDEEWKEYNLELQRQDEYFGHCDSCGKLCDGSGECTCGGPVAKEFIDTNRDSDPIRKYDFSKLTAMLNEIWAEEKEAA